MIYIAHRGNLTGPDPENENNPDVIRKVLEGYECEIDLWRFGRNWFLGHDQPRYRIPRGFLEHDGLWIHCKNISALDWLTRGESHLNFFWHDRDLYTITSCGYVWGNIGSPLISSLVVNYPGPPRRGERSLLPKRTTGICSDYIQHWKHR